MRFLDLYDSTVHRLRAAGDYVWPLGLRLILFWEFWEAGSRKLGGQNWFGDIPWASWQKGFPWPFSQLPTDLNWTLATGSEIVFSLALALGLFTRFAAFSLVIITMVATAAVHWPAEWTGLAGLWQGYVISADGAGNFKLPILFLLMLLPLVFHGGGGLSLDRVLVHLTRNAAMRGTEAVDAMGAALALAILGLAWVWVEPLWGGVFFVLASIPATRLIVIR
jgi:putative oxidoreductase